MLRSRSFLVWSLAALSVAAWTSSSCCKPPPPPPPVPRLIPPLNDAQVGEWLRLENGEWSDEMRVVEAGDYEVKIEHTLRRNGAVAQPPFVEAWHRNSFAMPVEGVIRSFERDRIQVRGKWYDCWRVDVYSHEGRRAYWISEEVFVHGCLKQANVGPKGIDDATALEAADWGAK